MVPFESLGTVSYSHAIATMVVSLAIWEIFNVRKWHNLEIWGMVIQGDLEMAPFGRSHASSY